MISVAYIGNNSLREFEIIISEMNVNLNIQISIEHFETLHDVIDSPKSNSGYDLFMLDVDSLLYEGEAIHTIKNLMGDSKSAIITSNSIISVEWLNIGVYYYIDGRILKKRTELIINDYIQKLDRDKMLFKYFINKSEELINCNHVVYFESYGKRSLFIALEKMLSFMVNCLTA